MHLSMLSRWGGGGRPGKGGGFDCNHRPVVGFFDRFNDLSSNILLTFGCYFDNPQCSGMGHLNGNSQLSSNAPPMPGLPSPPQRFNIDRCITVVNKIMFTSPEAMVEFSGENKTFGARQSPLNICTCKYIFV